MSELIVKFNEENEDLQEKLEMLRQQNKHRTKKKKSTRIMEPFRRDFLEERRSLEGVGSKIDYYENFNLTKIKKT